MHVIDTKDKCCLPIFAVFIFLASGLFILHLYLTSVCNTIEKAHFKVILKKVFFMSLIIYLFFFLFIPVVSMMFSSIECFP